MNLLFYLIFLQFLNPVPPLDPSEKLTNLIIKNLRYPAQARVNNEVGIVLISLKIDEKGELDSVFVLENPSELLTSESLRSIALLKANWESEMLGNNEFNKKYLMSFQFLSEGTDPITKEQIEQLIVKEKYEKALAHLNFKTALHPYSYEWLELRSKIYFQLGESVKFQTDYMKAKSLKREILASFVITAFGG
jgi:hypothetical protein